MVNVKNVNPVQQQHDNDKFIHANKIIIPGVILINMNGMKPTLAQKWKVKALSEKVKNVSVKNVKSVKC